MLLFFILFDSKLPFILKVDDDLKPVEWGLCLPDCPSQEVEIVCKDLPPFPALADLSENPKSVNYTIKGIIPNRTTNMVIPGVSGNEINKIKMTY